MKTNFIFQIVIFWLIFFQKLYKSHKNSDCYILFTIKTPVNINIVWLKYDSFFGYGIKVVQFHKRNLKHIGEKWRFKIFLFLNLRHTNYTKTNWIKNKKTFSLKKNIWHNLNFSFFLRQKKHNKVSVSNLWLITALELICVIPLDNIYLKFFPFFSDQTRGISINSFKIELTVSKRGRLRCNG